MPDFSAQLEAIKAVIESLPDHGGKLDALANAIKALPDYSAQLEAIKTAIEALPNYGDKLTALENAIKALSESSPSPCAWKESAVDKTPLLGYDDTPRVPPLAIPHEWGAGDSI